jgi:polyphosphate kinase 2 (PPK2 family)
MRPVGASKAADGGIVDYRKQFCVNSGEKVRLDKLDPSDTGKLTSEDEGKEDAEHYLKQVAHQQVLLYAEHKHSVLVVLQAMDAGGKDGTIRHVFSGVNPQGVDVASFKQPTPLELAHDFLWRVHAQAPRAGQIVIFNRSHYEDVLVTRVHKLVDKKACAHRYEHIRDFEALLVESGTTILKFFLHITRKSSSLVSRNAWMTQDAIGRSANLTIQSVNCGTITSTPMRTRSARPARRTRRGM